MPLPKFLNYFKSKKKTLNISSRNHEQYFDTNFYDNSIYKYFKNDLDYLKIFNYNPEKEDVSSFMMKILTAMLSREDLDNLQAMQNKLFLLMENYNNLSEEEKKHQAELITSLRLKIIKIMEEVKITFEGFDIQERSIPKELLGNSSDIAINFMLNIIRLGYLNKQITSLFGLTTGQYSVISEKEKIQRTEKEENKYQNILNTLDKVLCLIDSKKDKKEKYKILKELKSIKSKGKKLYNLFLPLL